MKFFDISQQANAGLPLLNPLCLSRLCVSSKDGLEKMLAIIEFDIISHVEADVHCIRFCTAQYSSAWYDRISHA